MRAPMSRHAQDATPAQPPPSARLDARNATAYNSAFRGVAACQVTKIVSGAPQVIDREGWCYYY